LRFDSDETQSVMDWVAAKHLRIFDGKPVHIKPDSRQAVLELAFHR